MTLWSYTALPARAGAGSGAARRGEIASESAHAARAALRRAGLRVVRLRPIAARGRGSTAVAAAISAHLRRRRGPLRAELFDGLATMLDAGVTVPEALASAAEAAGRSAGLRRLAKGLLEEVRAGSAVSRALASRPDWFDPAEAAMAEAGQRRGELAPVLRSLADRQERSADLTGRLAAVLAYPAIVACLGLGVVVLLSTTTLPKLADVLRGAGLEPPALTTAVMGFGRFVAVWWPVLGTAALSALAATPLVAARAGPRSGAIVRALQPAAARRGAVARLALDLSAMLRAGVPATDALRVSAAAFRGVWTAPLGLALRRAADAIEQGADLHTAFDDPRWFDPPFRRLVAAGLAGGDLPDMLARLGEREQRRARRRADRLAALVEPAVILGLAGLIGLVVLAAVLPLIRLQEIIA